MAKMDEIQQLVVDAEKNGYTNLHVEYDGPNGAPKIHAKRLQGAKPDIDARIRALKPQLIARLDPTPTKTRARNAKTASLPWLARMNKVINSVAEPDPTKHPYLHALYPESASGKALAIVPGLLAATVGLPETLLGSAVVGAGIGAGSAYEAGEATTPLGVAESAAGGALSMGLPAAGGKIPGLMKLMRGRHELIADLDAKAEGEYIANALGLVNVSKALKRGRTWVSALRDAVTQREAWQRMSDKLDTVRNDLLQKVKDQQEALTDQFNNTYGVAKSGKPKISQLKANKQMLRDYFAMKKKRDQLNSIPRAFDASLGKLKSLGKQGWDKGAFRDTKTGVEAVQSYDDIQGELRDVLAGNNQNLPFKDPSLLQTYDEANTEYKHYAAFRDLADNPKMLTTDPTGSGLPSGKLNNRELQLMLRNEPRSYQSRLGKLWDDFKTVVNRGEVDAENVDVQANVPSLRNVSGHAGLQSAPRGFMRNAIPLRGKYVGNQADRLPRLFNDAAKTKELLKVPPALIIGGAATGGNMQDLTAESPDAGGQ